MAKVRYFLLAALVSCNAACPRKPDAVPNVAAAPEGEVWLTAQQIADAKIVVAPVDDQLVDDTIMTGGKIAFDDLRVSHVFSPVTGRVTRIDAGVGNRVKKGDALAVLESPDVGIASSDLSKAQAGLIAAEHDFKREKALWEKPEGHATSQKDFEAAEDAYRKAKAEMERARQKAFLLRAGTVDAVTQSFVLRSGIDGEVVYRNVTPNVEVQGQYSGGTPVELFTIGELDKVWLLADLYEIDLQRVKVGSKVEVKVVSHKEPFKGTVEWVSGTLDPATRTAKFRVTLDNKDRVLRPEMYATVTVSVEERRALAIPKAAMVRLGDVTVAFAEDGKAEDGRVRFRRVPITVDDEGESGQWLVVRKGLTRGQRVVVSGGILLSGAL